MNYPVYIKECLNPKATKVTIVVGFRIPKFLTHSTNRIVLIDEQNLAKAISYHKEGFGVKNKNWLDSICLQDSYSSSLVVMTSLYYKANLIDSGENVIVGKSKFRSDYLLKSYLLFGEISLFSLAKAHYFGSESSQIENNARKKDYKRILANKFYEKVSSIIIDITQDEFNQLMKASNRYYIDSIINDSLNFNPGELGIETYRDNSFEGFEFTNYIRHPLRSYPKSIDNIGDLHRRALMPAPDIMLVKAGTGTGKTKLAIEMIKEFHRSNMSTVTISNLKAVVKSVNGRTLSALSNDWLSIESSLNYDKELELNIANSDSTLFEIESSQHLFTTLKSLTKQLIIERVNSAELIIIDEAEKVFGAIYSENDNYLGKNEKDNLKDIFKTILGGKSKVMLLDADLTDLVTTSIVKDFSEERRIVAGILPPKAIGGKESKSQVEAILGRWTDYKDYLLTHRLKPEQKNFIVCDSKMAVEKWLIEAEYFLSEGDEKKPDFEAALADRILVIVAVGRDIELSNEQKAFLANPSEEIHKYDTVIVSPVLKEGFHIDANHADKVIVFSSGVLVPKELIQFASRLRTAKKLVFALNKTDKNYSKDYYRYAYTKDEKFESKLKKHRNIILSNLEYALFCTLKHEGFNVQNVQEVLPKGDFQYEASSANESVFLPEILSMIRGEKSLSFHSQYDRRVSEAVMIFQSAIFIESYKNKTITVWAKSNKDGGLSLESMFDNVANNAEVLTHILPRDLNVDEWKNLKTKTAKMNKLLGRLGFKATRTSAGKKYIITKVE